MLDTLTTKHKIILATLVFLVVIIPVVSFIVSYRFRAQINSKASENAKTSTIEDLSLRPIVDNPTPKKSLLDELREDLEKESSEEASLIGVGGGNTLNLGPTLTFKLSIEGRPKTNQAEPKLFVGMAAGQAATNPQYLLSFTVDASSSGQPKEPLSLAGLTTGDTYTAYIKGQATLTSASTFTVKPTTADIGTINLVVGDLNDDNVINSLDRDILMKAFGSRDGSTKWNGLADFNLDGVINTSDLAYITKNMNKNGASGPWGSKLPASATSSATATSSGSLLKQNEASTSAQGGEQIESGPRDITPIRGNGYWMWVPRGI